ncbi:MAG TPA: hypothetical protein VGE07_17595 [Herpetosiphonaceae bacterium]
MNIWSWVMRGRFEAYANQDQDRIALAEALDEASPLFETHPEQARAILEQARATARRLNEPWWERFYDHWLLQLLLHHIKDYNAALELAVRAAVEVRKPSYQQFPQRICLQEDLISAYVGIDPLGHQQRIEQALDYMQREVAPSAECRYCLQGLRTSFETELGRLDRALAAGLEEMAAAQWSDHHLMGAYTSLCEIAYLRGDWQNLPDWAVAGEALAIANDDLDNLIEFLAWQAVCARRQGDEEAAQRLYRRATSRAGRMGVPPGRIYFDAICAYHELRGAYHLALKVRERQLATLAGSGQLYRTGLCHIQRCRLLKLLGKPLDEAAAMARDAIAQLSDPAPLLAHLAEAMA